MKTIRMLLMLVAATLFATTAGAAVNKPDGELPNDGRSAIQSEVRMKKWQQAPFALAASSKVIRFKGTVQAGEIDLTDAIGIILRTASGSLTAHYDSDTTKTWTLKGAASNVFLVDPAASTITVTGTDTAIEVGGF